MSSDEDSCLAELAEGLLTDAQPLQVVQDVAEPAQSVSDDIAGLADGMLQHGSQGLVLAPESMPRTVIRADRFGQRTDLGLLGSVVQQQLFRRYCLYHTDDQPAQPPAVVQGIMKQFVNCATLKSAVVASNMAGISRVWLSFSLQHFGCCLVHGGAFLIGAMTHCFRSLIVAKRYHPVAAISKMRYDETPLKLTLREHVDFFNYYPDAATAAVPESVVHPYMYAKILRLEWTLGLWLEAFCFWQGFALALRIVVAVVAAGSCYLLAAARSIDLWVVTQMYSGFLLRDTWSGRHKLLTIEVPTTLVPLDRTTAENEVAAILQTTQRVRHLDSFMSSFGLHSRLVCADRYSANLKAEKYLAAADRSRVSTVLGCAVHKVATCMKRGLQPFEGTVSGWTQHGNRRGSHSLARFAAASVG